MFKASGQLQLTLKRVFDVVVSIRPSLRSS